MHAHHSIIQTAIIAGLAAGAANADNLQRTALEVDGYAPVHGYIYINQGTGEHIVSYEAPQSTTLRGSTWVWDNSVIDPCMPTPQSQELAAIFTGVMDAEAGDLGSVDAVNYWNDWFEVPADTIIGGLTFGHFTQALDPGEDGVNDQELLFAFTEADHSTSQTTAMAHSPFNVWRTLGAEDDGANGAAIAGDGIIDFAEGNYWVYFLDFGSLDTPTDLELADTNGVSDGNFGIDSIFSGIPGVDLDGDGLYNCGFYIAIRQPNVAEGDGIIIRFPELAFMGLENPDGFDAASLANITPSGFPMAAPSKNLNSYELGNADWPRASGYSPWPHEPIGSTDAFGLYNANGESRGVFSLGGFECDTDAVTAPYYLNPWATPDFRLNVIPPIEETCFDYACNFSSCFAFPEDVADLADITAFLQFFLAENSFADLALPFGVYDLADISAFVTAFLEGCP